MLAAAQGVCGNDTARAAEIPPLLTLAGKWSSSSGTINGDRSLRGAGGQRAGGGGRGSTASRDGGTRSEVKKHTDPQKGIVGSHGYTTVWGGITIGYHIRKKADSSH